MSEKKQAYTSWDSNPDQAFALYSEAISNSRAISSTSSFRRDFSNLSTYSSSTPGLTQADFDWFRPSERVPTTPKDIISFGRYAYRRIGLIRNSIDLMADFACQGVRVAHRNKKIEKFFKAWFNQINGKHITERLCNLLFREANVFIRMRTAKINAKKREEMHKAIASPEVEIRNSLSISKNEIPWKYNFLDPLLIEPIGGPLSAMSDKPLYAVKVPPNVTMYINSIMSNPISDLNKILGEIPVEITQSIKSNRPIQLDPDKTYSFFYKKDDWQSFADPMTYAAYRDLILYEKLKLADQAALDGATSKIRVWKLGSLDHKLAPTPVASSALESMLSASVLGGTKDIIWGPDIDLLETSSEVSTFLGDEKYRPTLMAIYSALGIPPTLTGSFGASGTTNNFISLKTLTERLNYVRDIVIDFWETQISLVQDAMGFRFPAIIEFDYMNLEDVSSLVTLLQGMADRNILSDEFLQRFVRANPELENRRIQAENNSKLEKTSPFHVSDKSFHLKKIALQSGISAPSEVGLELEEKKEGEESVLTMRQKQSEKKLSVQGKPPTQTPMKSGGRPKNSIDTTKRKTRTFKPALKASMEIWAKEAQTKISELLNPGILHEYSKSNMRSLSAEEYNYSEELKFSVLMSIDPYQNIDIELINSVLAGTKINSKVLKQCNKLIAESAKSLDRKLTIEEIRDIRASYYASYHIRKTNK